MTHEEKVVYLNRIFKLDHTREKWLKVIDLLGNVPDKKVARKIGVGPNRVCAVRISMGIAPVSFPKRCETYGSSQPRRPVIIC